MSHSPENQPEKHGAAQPQPKKKQKKKKLWDHECHESRKARDELYE
jgi:hypothetical protein